MRKRITYVSLLVLSILCQGCKKDVTEIDISVMGKDMVYATVFQMLQNPNSYIGKRIRIEGTHYSTFYEPTGLTYHYVLIEDATACCSQGLEFVLTDEFEYPDEGEKVSVVGTYSTYEEEGILYCTLLDSVLE